MIIRRGMIFPSFSHPTAAMPRPSLFFLFVVFLGVATVSAQTLAPVPPLEEKIPTLQERVPPLVGTSQLNHHDFPVRFLEVAVSKEGYSFEELWEVAKQCNPKIREVYCGIAAARGEAVQAGLYLNPTFTPTMDNIGVGTGPKVGAFLSQEIVTARKKRLDRAVAGYDVRVARTNYEMEYLRLQNEVRIAYYGLLHAQLNYHIHRYGVAIANEQLGAAEDLRKKGKGEPIDVLQFRLIQNEQSIRLRQSKNDWDIAWGRLAALVGRPDWPNQSVRGTLLIELPQHNMEAVWAVLEQTSPEIATAQLKVQQARTYLVRQQKEKIPNITAGVSYARDITPENNVPFVSVAVPLKVYDRNQGNIAKAQADLAASIHAVETVRLELRKRLLDVYRDYENAAELVTMYEESVIQDAYQSLTLATEAYKKGNKTYLELYQQRNQIMETLIRYIDSRKTLATSAALLDGLLLQ